MERLQMFTWVTSGFGVLYGLAVSAILDEAIVLSLKLSPAPSRTLFANHLDGLAAYGVFGACLEAARLTLEAIAP